MARTQERRLLPVLLLLTAAGHGAYSQPPPCAPIQQHPCSDISSLRQSPIDIDTCRLTDTIHRPLRISWLDTRPQRMTVDNTGDRVAGDVFWAQGKVPTISGGNLPGQFVYALYDLHWGANSSIGSEHGLSGQRYAGELHLGFRNVKYDTIEEALGQVDGVVAVAVFLDQDTSSPGRGIAALSPALFQIKEALSSVELESPPTLRELLPRNLRRYVQYDGSFSSVPPCAEAAIWIVLLTPIRIVDVELELLRDLRDESGERLCTSSNRQFQPLSGRQLYSKAGVPGC